MSAAALFHRVLLIEDDPSHALLIKRALRSFCTDIEHVTSVSAALQYLDSELPSLMVSDLNLPDTKGVQHVAKLTQACGECPIVVLTSSTSLKDAVAAMQLGARDYIVKSFDNDFTEVLGLSLSRVRAALELEAERKQLERDIRTLQVAIEDSNDGLAVLTREGKVQYCNSAFKNFVKFCGGSPGDLLSICNERLEKPESLRSSLLAKIENFSSGMSWNAEVLFAESKERAYDLGLSVVGMKEGPQPDRADLVVWVRDISEQKRRERFQRDILSTTKHDLKGPLGAIMTGTELLRELVQGQEKPFQLSLRILSAAQGAVNLIDEFLSARQMEEGNFVLRPDYYSLRALCADVRSNFETIAAARSISLRFEIGRDHKDESDAEAQVDKLAFERVLGNLLSNAIKFTPKGGAITVRVWSEDGLRVQVQDTGSGMEPAETRRVFERYSRLEKHGKVEGTGLGLFIVRSIVEAHGGAIEVTSKLGEGTLFEISIPHELPLNEHGELISLDYA